MGGEKWGISVAATVTIVNAQVVDVVQDAVRIGINRVVLFCSGIADSSAYIKSSTAPPSSNNSLLFASPSFRSLPQFVPPCV